MKKVDSLLSVDVSSSIPNAQNYTSTTQQSVSAFEISNSVGIRPVDIEWKNVNFSVQLDDGKQKRILTNLSGRVRNGDCVAIMGPSGSGKTTLLNLLACRAALVNTGKTTLEGKITMNGEKMIKTEFNKIGAYVQQDDVLIETMTPRECLMFAARMIGQDHRTALINVENTIAKLKLKSCQDTYIGGHMLKGVSGGERKRVCLGFELIQNPSFLLLDEPTSGLDSHTAI